MMMMMTRLNVRNETNDVSNNEVASQLFVFRRYEYSKIISAEAWPYFVCCGITFFINTRQTVIPIVNNLKFPRR